MMGITAAELAAMRDIADTFLPDTCTVQTITGGVDSTGSPVDTFANTYTNVPCRVDPASPGDEAVMSNALEGQSAWWLNIKYDQAIAIEYQVVHAGVTYQIKGVWDTQSYRTIRRALMVRVN